MVFVYQEVNLSVRKDSETIATTGQISVNRIYFITFPLNVVWVAYCSQKDPGLKFIFPSSWQWNSEAWVVMVPSVSSMVGSEYNQKLSTSSFIPAILGNILLSSLYDMNGAWATLYCHGLCILLLSKCPVMTAVWWVVSVSCLIVWTFSTFQGLKM